MTNSRGTSKYLSYLLRHHPERANLTLDPGGWVSIETLLENTPDWLTQEALDEAVKTNAKQRFAVKNGLIRASQGHSILVDLGLEPTEPPEHLFHGTYHKVVASIERTGLSKMGRHAVHMASETTTAETVGRRSGTPVLFRVQARAMHEKGYTFFVSANGVWLTEHVPPQYLEKMP